MSGKIGFQRFIDGKEVEPKQAPPRETTILDLVQFFLEDNYRQAHPDEPHELITLNEFYKNLQRSFPGEYTKENLVLLLHKMGYKYENIEMEVHYLVHSF